MTSKLLTLLSFLSFSALFAACASAMMHKNMASDVYSADMAIGPGILFAFSLFFLIGAVVSVADSPSGPYDHYLGERATDIWLRVNEI